MTKKLLAWAMLVALMFFAGCATASKDGQKPELNEGWEYKSVTLTTVPPGEFNFQMQKFQQQGWYIERSSIFGNNLVTLVLRRPKY